MTTMSPPRLWQITLLLVLCLALSYVPQPQEFLDPLCFATRAELDQALDDYLSGQEARRADVELVYGPIESWCTTHITDFSHLFDGYLYPSFNEDIGGWDLSNAKTAAGMFFRATSFNSDISSWDVSNLEDMSGMFAFAASFSVDLSNWSTGKVKYMRAAFDGAESFQECHSFIEWDISSVIDATSMLLGSGCDRQEELVALLGEEAFDETSV